MCRPACFLCSPLRSSMFKTSGTLALCEYGFWVVGVVLAFRIGMGMGMAIGMAVEVAVGMAVGMAVYGHVLPAHACT